MAYVSEESRASGLYSTWCMCNKERQTKTSCANCVNWGTALEGIYYHSNPLALKQLTWKNVNSSLIHGSHIEVANAFALNLPGGQRPTQFSDYDTAHILKIMLGCGEYHKHNAALPNFPQPYETIRKVSVCVAFLFFF